MPANINYTNGRYSAFYADGPAWHRLGVVVAGAQTPEDAQRLAGTDYVVDVAPSYALIDGEYVLDPDGFKTYRTDTRAILGSVGADYRPIQNLTPMQLLMEIVRTNEAGIVAHAALGKGERLFAVLELARLKGMRIKTDPSVTDGYLVAQWWHDGTGALSIGPSAVRVDCQNMANMQLGYAESRGRLVRIAHMGDIRSAVAEAQRILGFVDAESEKWIATMNALADTPVPSPVDRWLGGYLERLVPIPPDMERPYARLHARETIADLFANSKTLVGVPQSAYRVAQSVIEYADHYRPVRGEEGLSRSEKRFRSLTDGPAATLKKSAVDMLREEFAVRV